MTPKELVKVGRSWGVMAQSASSSAPTYRIKWQILDPALPSVATVQQGHAGPCPLLALANALLLRRAIELPRGTPVISEEHLLGCIASHPAAVEYLDVLPRLAREVDIDPCFCGTTEFSSSPELSLFKSFGIRVVHGAIPDPQDERLSCISPFSYNQVCDQLVQAAESHSSQVLPSSQPSPGSDEDTESLISPVSACTAGNDCHDDSDDEPDAGLYHEEELAGGKWEGPLHLRRDSWCGTVSASSAKACPAPPKEQEPIQSIAQNAAYVQAFFDDHQSMLTHHGLALLHETLAEGEVAVHFYNNHFSVLRMHEALLYTLVTDVGYYQQPSIMYESLNDLDGNNAFHDSNFKASVMAPTSPRAPVPAGGSRRPKSTPAVYATGPSAMGSSATGSSATGSSATGFSTRPTSGNRQVRKSTVADSKSRRTNGCVVM